MPFAPGFFPNNIASKEFVREAARNQAVAIQDARLPMPTFAWLPSSAA